MNVTEEMIAAGRAVASGVDDTAFERIYLAMRSKDHSIAVDDVREASALRKDMMRIENRLLAAHGIWKPAMLIEVLKDIEAIVKPHAYPITAIGSQSIAPDGAELCDACNGSGFGAGDGYCGKCGGAGGYPLAKDEERHG